MTKNNIELEIKNLDALFRLLENQVTDLNNKLNGRNRILARMVIHQNNHISRLYDLIHELSTSDDTKEMTSHIYALKAIHEKEVNEIFPPDES